MDRKEIAYLGACAAIIVGGSVAIWIVLNPPSYRGWQQMFAENMAYSSDITISVPIQSASYQTTYARMDLTFPKHLYGRDDAYYQICLNQDIGLHLSLPITEVHRSDYQGEEVQVKVWTREADWPKHARPRDENGNHIWSTETKLYFRGESESGNSYWWR